MITMSVRGTCSIEGCKRVHMYNSDVCYLCKRPKSRPKPQPLTSEQIREAAKASSEPLFRCDDHGLCEYDFIMDGRCLHCGALGPPDQLEFLTRRQDRFELVMLVNAVTSPAENHALRGVMDALEERDSKLISEDGGLDSPTSRIERLSTSADILKMSREHLDDTAYAALESGLLEIDSRECPWEEAIQIEATKGWWLPDDDLEAIRGTMPHSSQCYCDGCLPQRQREQVKRGKSSYNSMTKAELRTLLHERDLPYDDGFENETKAELIELLMQDDSRNSFPMLVITILAVIGCIGVAVVYWPLVLLILALIIPGYIYAKLTGRGEMAEAFAIEKIGVDPDAHPEGWHDKPKKEEYPSTYSGAFFTFWSDPYFLLGFSAPILYAIYQNQVLFTEKHALFYIVAAVLTNPFFGDPKESPFVRAGTGIHIATTGIVVLGFVLVALVTLLVLLLFVYWMYLAVTSPECFGMTPGGC